MFVFELILDLLDVLFDRSPTLYSGYRAAWRKRQKSGNAAIEVLTQELKTRSVPGAYDPLDSPRLAPAILAWEAGTVPRDARAELKRAPKRRPRPR